MSLVDYTKDSIYNRLFNRIINQYENLDYNNQVSPTKDICNLIKNQKVISSLYKDIVVYTSVVDGINRDIDRVLLSEYINEKALESRYKLRDMYKERLDDCLSQIKVNINKINTAIEQIEKYSNGEGGI